MIVILKYLNMNNIESSSVNEESTRHMINLIIYGAIGGIIMIFPGVSGSIVLLVLGKYEMIRSYIDQITKFDIEIYLGIFGNGAILGIIFSAKLLSF